jgi:protein SCO1/2
MRGFTATAAMAIGVVCLVVAGPAAAAQFRGGLLEPPRPAADLSLRTQDGKPFRLSREHGKVVALWFGYTFCPDVCPTTLAELTQARQQLGKDAERLSIVFVTVDPERDTPERLREYVKAFGGDFVAATGTPEQLAQARKAYGVVAKKQVVSGTSAAYLIDHSAFVYVVDPAGRLRLMFPFGMSVEDMVHDFKLLLH